MAPRKKKLPVQGSYVFYNEIPEESEGTVVSLDDPTALKNALKDASLSFHKVSTLALKLASRLEGKNSFPAAFVAPLRKVVAATEKTTAILDPLTNPIVPTTLHKSIGKACRESAAATLLLRELLKKSPTKTIFGSRLPGAKAPLPADIAKDDLESVGEGAEFFWRRFRRLARKDHTASSTPKRSSSKTNLQGISTTSSFMKEFMETAKEKGWISDESELPIVEAAKQEEAETHTDLPISEGFQQSSNILKELEVGHDRLLPAEFSIGLIKVPIVIVQGGRSPDTTLLKLSRMGLGYEVHKVYDNYVAIDHMVLMGLHRRMVMVYDTSSVRHPTKFWKALNKPVSLFDKKERAEAATFKKLKIKLDTTKFATLAPFLEDEYPEHQDLLKKVGPVNPALRFGSHYYCPLLPYSLGDSRKLRITSWSPLFKKEN
jgi:hypothetical protein